MFYFSTFRYKTQYIQFKLDSVKFSFVECIVFIHFFVLFLPHWGSRYGPPVRTQYRVIVENMSSRTSWQVMCSFEACLSTSDSHEYYIAVRAITSKTCHGWVHFLWHTGTWCYNWSSLLWVQWIYCMCVDWNNIWQSRLTVWSAVLLMLVISATFLTFGYMKWMLSESYRLCNLRKCFLQLILQQLKEMFCYSVVRPVTGSMLHYAMLEKHFSSLP